MCSLIIPDTLTQEQIDSFKELFKKHYDIELTDDEVISEALNLIELVAISLE